MKKLFTVLLAWCMITTMANAKTYKIIVPNEAGTGSDINARIFAEKLKDYSEHKFIVTNVPGAQGIKAHELFVNTKDNDEILFTHWGRQIFLEGTMNLKFSTMDYRPIIMISESPLFLLTRDTKPLTENSWVAISGGPSQVATTILRNKSGINFNIILYPSDKEIFKEMMGGAVDFTFTTAPTAVPMLKTKQLGVMYTTQTTPAKDLETVPTSDKHQWGFNLSNWQAIYANKYMTSAEIAEINAAFSKAMDNPELQRKFEELGTYIPKPEQRTSEYLDKRQRAELKDFKDNYLKLGCLKIPEGSRKIICN